MKDTEVLFVRHNRLQRAAAVTSAKRWGDDRKGELPLWRLTTRVGLSGSAPSASRIVGAADGAPGLLVKDGGPGRGWGSAATAPLRQLGVDVDVERLAKCGALPAPHTSSRKAPIEVGSPRISSAILSPLGSVIAGRRPPAARPVRRPAPSLSRRAPACPVTAGCVAGLDGSSSCWRSRSAEAPTASNHVVASMRSVAQVEGRACGLRP